MLDLEPIKARLSAATPGPWSSCPDDGCKCVMVLCRDYPVAEVTKGKWGDDYPAIRLVGISSFDTKAAMANRAFIREAPADIAALIAEVEKLRALCKS